MSNECTFNKYSKELTKLFHIVADACIRGEFGNGRQRLDNLKSLGFSTDQAMRIQRIVNHKMKNKLKK